MNPFDILTEYDKDFIKDYIKVFGPTSNNQFEEYKMTSINKILDAWNNAKNEYLFKMFGGENLILSRPYSYSMQAEAISLEIEKNMNSPKNPYRLFKNWFDGEVVHNAYCDITITNMQGKDWSELQHYYYYSKWHPFHNCLTAYALAANAYLGDD